MKEIPAIAKYYEQFGARLPKALTSNLEMLRERLKAVSTVHVNNKQLLDWVLEVRALCGPQDVHWVSGSEEEYADQASVYDQTPVSSTNTLDDPRHPSRSLAKTCASSW